MSYWLNLYTAMFKVSFLGQIQYRASGFIWMLGGIIYPLIFLVVWASVAEAQGGDVDGISPGEFAAYYITFMVVNQMTFTWIMNTFQFRIQFGSMAMELLRPIHPIHVDITDNLAYKLFNLIITVPAVLALIWLFGPVWNVTMNSFLIAIPALVLGFIGRFCLEWALSLTAFWFTRITAVNESYFALRMLASGQVAPLSIMPGWAAAIAWGSPFYWSTGFVVDVFLNRLPPNEIWAGFGMQVLWILITFALMAGLWRIAIKTFSAVGN